MKDPSAMVLVEFSHLSQLGVLLQIFVMLLGVLLGSWPGMDGNEHLQPAGEYMEGARYHHGDPLFVEFVPSHM